MPRIYGKEIIMQATSPLLRILPYAGALPFVLGAAAKLSPTLPNLIYLIMFMDVQHLVLSYALVIIAFMAGVQWGQYVAGTRPRLNLLLSSNAVALVAWGCYIRLPPDYLCFAFIGLFALVYFIDTQLELPPQYLQTRRNVTLIVCTCLALIAIT